VSLRITEIRYTRQMIHCNYCDRRLCPHGWFTSWQRAEEWAREKGWSVWPYGPHSDLLSGGMHVCPACAEKQEGRS
jgi:hypothetical protein